MKTRFMLVISVVLIAGCGLFVESTVKVTLRSDGCTLEELDSAAKELQEALLTTSAYKCTSFRSKGQMNIYATAGRGTNRKHFLQEVNDTLASVQERWPEGVKLEGVKEIARHPDVSELAKREADKAQPYGNRPQ